MSDIRDRKYGYRRMANFEALRVIAMFMVIVLHYLAHGGLLPGQTEELSRDTVTGALIESFCIAAVNVWVLISGYFLSKTGVSIKRLVRVVVEVLFYTVAITGVMVLTGNGSGISGGAYGLLEYFFPISSEHYWFATAYVFMYLFAPLLNKGVLSLSRKQLKYTIIGLLIWFSLIKSVVPVAFPTDDYGYGFGWFLCLYLIAAYMRRYEVSFLNTFKKSLAIYLSSSVLIFIITVVTQLINERTGRLSSWLGTPFHYNFLLVLTAALGLFGMFRHTQMKEGIAANAVRALAPLTFGIYLLHEHSAIRDRWLVWMQEFIGEIPRRNPFLLVIHLITSAIIVFLAGAMVDFIRRIIFAWLQRILSGTKPAAMLRSLDSSIHKNTVEEERSIATEGIIDNNRYDNS